MVLLPPLRGGVPDQSLHKAGVEAARSAVPCRTRARRRRYPAARKIGGGGISWSQNERRHPHSPSTTEPTKTLRGALAVGDAVQAAPSNPAARPKSTQLEK